MRKSYKRFISKTNLLVLLLGLFVVTCFGQNEQITKCKDRACWIALYTKTIESNPNDAVAYLNRGRVYFPKEPNRAIQDFNKALELNPKYYEAYNMLGIVYMETGKHDQAIIVFNKTIELFPKNSTTYVNRGTLYSRQPDFDKALADYNKAIELEPNDGTAYLSRGSIYYQQRDFNKALADFNRTIEIDPDDWLNYRVRGNLYLMQGEKERADADLQKAKELKDLEEKRKTHD